MSTTTISSKGQITLPAALVRARHLLPGTQLEVVDIGTAIVLLPIGDSLVDQLAGATAGIYGDPEQYVDDQRAEWPSTT